MASGFDSKVTVGHGHFFQAGNLDFPFGGLGDHQGTYGCREVVEVLKSYHYLSLAQFDVLLITCFKW